jgi:NAD(P)-dependent dehydrogenase (short-subunit alcohol dehydrogenase family)
VYAAGLDRLCAEELPEAATQPFVADLTDRLEVADLAKRVMGEVGNVSFLVNVADGLVAPSHEDQLPRLPTRAFPMGDPDDIDEIVGSSAPTRAATSRAPPSTSTGGLYLGP